MSQVSVSWPLCVAVVFRFPFVLLWQEDPCPEHFWTSSSGFIPHIPKCDKWDPANIVLWVLKCPNIYCCLQFSFVDIKMSSWTNRSTTRHFSSVCVDWSILKAKMQQNMFFDLQFAVKSLKHPNRIPSGFLWLYVFWSCRLFPEELHLLVKLIWSS